MFPVFLVFSLSMGRKNYTPVLRPEVYPGPPGGIPWHAGQLAYFKYILK